MSDGELERLPEDPDNPYPLGRHRWHDPANRAWPARGVVTPVELPPPRVRPWWARHAFDQGQESSCTAQAAAGVCFTSPHRLTTRGRRSLVALDAPDERFQLYRVGQRHDPWEGEEPTYYGSSTDAPFRVLRDRGLVKEWRWIFGLEDALAVLRAHGPFAAGTTWTRPMFHPRDDGHLELGDLDRDAAGGHAYEVLHDDADDRRVRCVNSWGYAWGQRGRFWLTYDQLEALLDHGGEAVTAVL